MSQHARLHIVRQVTPHGRGYEYWYGHIRRTDQWLWLLDCYEEGEAIDGGRFLTEEDAKWHAQLWMWSFIGRTGNISATSDAE